MVYVIYQAVERVMDQLTTQFVCLRLPLERPPLALQKTIVQALEEYGTPLRWAITRIEGDQVVIEAVVLVTTQVK
ncbi:hypothetical protein L3556_02470 [Candidatus Synechococcus calcipolaris G9]|uniref:Uncharacterized protein n=1 Tax=Candidatus Synechococcus calcipolaris G9 TaxID=1497997 RepID=A0ABT6EVH2_9SYNE|nr:hypothetical protein [Candidatus Synechococcus calcipolaris]MDG2989806.1 hypothetical protein [Candidatus Synechococcus calcipolaris G9]